MLDERKGNIITSQTKLFLLLLLISKLWRAWKWINSSKSLIYYFSLYFSCKLNNSSQLYRYSSLWVQGAHMNLKIVYKVKGNSFIFNVRTFCFISIVGYHTHPLCKHNILFMSHEIVEPNKLPHNGYRLTLIQFVMTHL